MIKFKNSDGIYLSYESDMRHGNNEWVYSELKKSRRVHIKSTFFFEDKDLVSKEKDPDSPVVFKVCGKSVEGYYKIPRRILHIKYDLYLHDKLLIDNKVFFTDDKGISLFGSLDKFGLQKVYIAGDHPDAITSESFKLIKKSVPNSHEKRLYVSARIDSVLKNFFETGQKSEEKLKKYLNKKPSLKGKDLKKELLPYELKKYELILKKLDSMLNSETEYNESQWQKEILEIILLIYPKYVFVCTDTPVKDIYSDKTRKLDFLLADSEGNIDIIEIKKPFDNCIVTQSQYRDNFIPLRELSGTVMQIEKYLFYLKSWGKKGEDFLTKKYSESLPDGFRIQITNPCGLIVMGREKDLTSEQKRDFEVIKRQYKNVADIITYDDLVRRLKFTISQLRKE